MKQTITILFYILCLTGCTKDMENKVCFVGDSEIARWDLQSYFPTLLTENKGVSGSGLKYIQEIAGCMQGKETVVLFGTNDLQWAYSGNIDNYVDEYVAAVKALDADKTYLISIYPRCFAGDDNGINQKIELLNQKIKDAVTGSEIVYIDVYPLMLKDGNLNMQYSYDGLHLNPFGYELVTHEVNKYLL